LRTIALFKIIGRFILTPSQRAELALGWRRNQRDFRVWGQETHMAIRWIRSQLINLKKFFSKKDRLAAGEAAADD
jgi:hypothetical protein